jgi:bifunctional non-homologous end joining protein LigD
MVLDDYRRKRAFERTPEPPPGRGEAPGNRFYVQRHQARRLHYDLRLEMDGVLKSWAVPKGPTLDPAEKRLAVLVEDHPLEYGNFEGTIPAGNYGAGAVTVWDRGTYEVLGDVPMDRQLARGDLKFRLHGEKLMGEFALVLMKGRGKGNEWLLIKKKDFAVQPGWDPENHPGSVLGGALDPALLPGAVEAPMFTRLVPMLAKPSLTLPEGPDWLYEVKWDGFRALCFLKEGKARLLSRTGKWMDANYPELAAIPQHIAAQTAVLDGEIVAIDEQGLPSFARLQNRISPGRLKAGQLAHSQPVTLFVFDLLYLNGYDLRAVPLVERKRLLAALVKPNPLVRYSEHFTGNGKQLTEFTRERGLEGVMAKRASSPYESRRSGDWLKVKVVSQQDFVIGGWTEGERDGFGSLVLGYYDHGKLKWAGNVGSGFTEESIRNVRRLLKPLETRKSPFAEAPEMVRGVTWVKPRLACTVKFSSWTHDDHLRAPVFLGIRPDLTPAEMANVVRESAAQAEPEPASPRVVEPLLGPRQKEAALTICGHRLKFTNLDKVFYPREGHKKRDLINYYHDVAGLILPYLKDRPLSLKRYPNGIESEYFFQKRKAESFPSWLRTEVIGSESGKEPIEFVIGDDEATLLFLTNLGCIDQNTWMSRVGSLEHPDFILLDLDPYAAEYDRIVEAAQLLRQKLDLLEIEGCPKTTGGDGMHVYVPVEPRYTYQQTRTFAEILARLLAGERPDLFTTPRAVAKREKGKVYFDYLQNAEGMTIAAPYVLRAHPGAPVSTPLRWSEMTRGLTPTQFHLGNVRERFAQLGDLFRPVLTKPQRLEPALEKLEKLVREAVNK